MISADIYSDKICRDSSTKVCGTDSTHRLLPSDITGNSYISEVIVKIYSTYSIQKDTSNCICIGSHSEVNFISIISLPLI